VSNVLVKCCLYDFNPGLDYAVDYTVLDGVARPDKSDLLAQANAKQPKYIVPMAAANNSSADIYSAENLY
jgi:hypothetical protein